MLNGIIHLAYGSCDENEMNNFGFVYTMKTDFGICLLHIDMTLFDCLIQIN